MFVNTTPHPITICDVEGNVTHRLPKAAVPARARTVEAYAGTVDGVAITDALVDGIDHFPPKRDGVVYIASAMVAQHLGLRRPDVVSPGQLLRDDEGRVIGCIGLKRWG